MLNRFLNSQSKTLTFAAILLAISSIFSALLGLIRDRLLAGRFGASESLDIYFAAFKIPDFVYGILITGGLAAVFLPVLAEYFSRNQPESNLATFSPPSDQKKNKWPAEALELTNNVLNCFLIFLILICGILAIFTPWLINLVAPGFRPGNKALASHLTRIMFLSPIFFGLSSVFSGILQYFQRFLVYSLAPILYNLGIIFGILFFVPLLGISGLAYGVIFGALLHFLIQIPAAKSLGYSWQAFLNFKSPALKKIFKLMTPRTIGVAAYHLNLLVITAIASTLIPGSIAIFNFANNLQALPVGLIGVPFALAAFPLLSRAWANGKEEEFLENFSLAFRQILFLVIPISILFFLLRAQIVRLILGTGQFGWLETRLTAASLGLFSLGIFAFCLIPFLARAFYSLQDTKTPLVIGLISIVLNIFLSLLFVWLLKGQNIFQIFIQDFLKLQGIRNIQVISLPLALSISGIFQFSFLLTSFSKKIASSSLKEIWQSFQKIVIASIFLAIFSYFALQVGAKFVDMRTFFGVFEQTIFAILVGVFVYFLVSLILKSPEIKQIKLAISKQFRK